MILWIWISLEKQYVLPEKHIYSLIELFGGLNFFCATVSFSEACHFSIKDF